MNICVVALGKIGLPLAVQFASKGHQVIGADVNEKVVELVNAGIEPFPGEPDLDVKLKEAVDAGLLTRDHGHRGRGRRSPTPSWSSCRCSSTPRASRTSAGWTPRPRRSPPGLKPGTLVSYETTLPVGTTRNRWAPMLAEGSGLTAGRGLPPGLQPGAGADRPGLRRPAPLPQARRRHRRGVRRSAAWSSTRRCSTSTSAPTCRGRTACGTWAPPRPPSWPSSPRPPTATSTSAWPTSSPGSPTSNGIDVKKVIEACNIAAVQPHPPARHRGRRPLHPDLPADVPVERPGGHRRALGPRGERRDAGVRRRPAGRRLRRPGRRGRAGARRRLPRRRQGDRVLRRLPDRRGAARRAARSRTSRTRCTRPRS